MNRPMLDQIQRFPTRPGRHRLNPLGLEQRPNGFVPMLLLVGEQDSEARGWMRLNQACFAS